MGKNYWMVVESLENFEITKGLGFTLHGLGSRYRRRAQRMQPDDLDRKGPDKRQNPRRREDNETRRGQERDEAAFPFHAR